MAPVVPVAAVTVASKFFPRLQTPIIRSQQLEISSTQRKFLVSKWCICKSLWQSSKSFRAAFFGTEYISYETLSFSIYWHIYSLGWSRLPRNWNTFRFLKMTQLLVTQNRLLWMHPLFQYSNPNRRRMDRQRMARRPSLTLKQKNPTWWALYSDDNGRENYRYHVQGSFF